MADCEECAMKGHDRKPYVQQLNEELMALDLKVEHLGAGRSAAPEATNDAYRDAMAVLQTRRSAVDDCVTRLKAAGVALREVKKSTEKALGDFSDGVDATVARFGS
jgi:hypothetical protein